MQRPSLPIVILAAVVLSGAAVYAFSAASTGSRAFSASVVNDADAFLALESNGLSPHKPFVTETAGKIVLSFASATGVSGTGINRDSTYEFDSLVNITNKGTTTVNADVTIGGTDATLCVAALTSTTSQTSASYVADPTPVSLSTGSKAYLGLKLLATGKNVGDLVACTFTISATR